MSNIEKLLEVMARLRDPDGGCPWDVEQTFSTVAPYTIEEAYEVADAIERDDMPGLRDELGDLLLQVVFHARMAEEAGLFDFDAVAGGIHDKMLRRHPHVFGSDEERAAGMLAGSWERIKAEERAVARTGSGPERGEARAQAVSGVDGDRKRGDRTDASVLAGIARSLPALKRAQKLGKRAASVGFDWQDRNGVRDKIKEELDELEAATEDGDPAAIEEELGDLLFSLVNLARHLGIDPEHALSRANGKFERRFREMERTATGELSALDLDELESAWQAAKTRTG